MASVETSNDPTVVYKQLDVYQWDNDPEFQSALASILRSASTPEQVAHLTTRARCYYFTRKFKVPVSFEGYQHWLRSQVQPATIAEDAEESNAERPHTSPLGDAPPPASFAEICELIAEGKPIPGIKEIPDTILEGQGTQSQAVKRKKPWEKDAFAAPTPSWAIAQTQ